MPAPRPSFAQLATPAKPISKWLKMSRERESMENVPMIEDEEGGEQETATRRPSPNPGATPRPSGMLTGDTARCPACLQWGPEQYDCSSRPTTSDSAHPPTIGSSLEEQEMNRLANLDLEDVESESDQPLEMICPPRSRHGSNNNTQSPTQPGSNSGEGSRAASESPTMMFRIDRPT
jgi:hypothetical protein